jgi:hypothetical protein
MEAVRELLAQEAAGPSPEVLGRSVRSAHAAAVGFFNYVEAAVAKSDLLDAYVSEEWANSLAETCHAVLGSAAIYFERLPAVARKAGIDPSAFSLDATAFAAMQRMVKGYLPDLTSSLRSRLVAAGMPVRGFDYDPRTDWGARMKRAAAGMKVEAVLAFVFGVIFIGIMLALAVAIPEPSANQAFTFRVVLSLAGAAIGAILPGFIRVEGTLPKFTLRAGGAIALFLIVYLLNPPSLVTAGG